jgi:hypothetical protein
VPCSYYRNLFNLWFGTHHLFTFSWGIHLWNLGGVCRTGNTHLFSLSWWKVLGCVTRRPPGCCWCSQGTSWTSSWSQIVCWGPRVIGRSCRRRCSVRVRVAVIARICPPTDHSAVCSYSVHCCCCCSSSHCCIDTLLGGCKSTRLWWKFAAGIVQELSVLQRTIGLQDW